MTITAARRLFDEKTLTATVIGTLHVTSFTPTATGFVINFNRVFDPAQLNLYSGIDPTGTVLGVADVTLVGNTVGNVRGTLLLESSNTAIRFVATSGVLAADTYTVTLRSATNGFIGVSPGGVGDTLDGNADNTAGDNYVKSDYVVSSSSARILSVPNFARGPGQSVVCAERYRHRYPNHAQRWRQRHRA